MKKNFLIILTLMLSLLLASCGNKNNENKNISIQNNEQNTSIDKGEPNKKTNTVITYEGSNDNFEAKVLFIPFSNEDEKAIKDEFGEKSDEYLSLQDDRPNYKVETYLVYTGEGIDNIEKLEKVSYELNSNSELLNATKEVSSKEDIVKSLQGQLNLTDKTYMYEHITDVTPLDENNTFHLKISSGNKQLDSNIELKYLAQ